MTKKKDPKYLGIPNICFSITERGDKLEKEFAKQRKKRGFDDSECWSLDMTIARFVLPRLKRFRKTRIGFPMRFDTSSEWDYILDKMIRAFELVVDNDEDHPEEVNEGMNLFRKYFFHLWS